MIINTSIGGKSSLEDGSVTTSKIADNAVTWPKLAADARPIRRNLLINPCFVGGGSQQGGGQLPINQRVNTEYTGTAYGIDGWNARTSNQKIVLTADCVEIHSGANQADFGQPFQVPTVLIGETVTFSALVKGDGIFAPHIGVLANTPQGNITGSPSTEWQLLTTTVTISPLSDANGIIRPRIFLDAANSQNPTPICYVKAAALELGDHCTAFSQDADGNWVLNVIPDYYDELKICQLYYRPPTEQLIPIAWLSGRGYGRIPVQMRANPSVIVDKLGLVLVNGQTYAVSTVASTAQVKDWGVQIVLEVAEANIPENSVGMYRSNSIALDSGL